MWHWTKMGYKTSKLINSKCLRSIYFSFIHSYIDYANITWANTNKTKLEGLFGKQKQAAHIIFNQDRFTHARPLLKTLNAINVYQINLLQVLVFMHKIKTNSSPQIFLHQFQIVNHKHATWYSRNNFKEPKRETIYAKYCIHSHGPVIWNSFLNETAKNILSQHFFKLIIKGKISFKLLLNINIEATLKNKGAWWQSLKVFCKLLPTTNSILKCHPSM